MTDTEKASVGSIDETVFDAKLDKVWRKVDIYVLPVVAMFYLLSFLDRTNLGNARVAGLQTDLKMNNYEYCVALTVTYIPYIIAELPSNLVLKAVGPNLLLPTMLTLWGIVTTLQGVVTTYQGLLACRFFLGLCEGGVFPGLVLYLSFWYPRRQLQSRISAFFSTASLSGAFSGLLAYGIIRMNGVGHRPGWAWIFILEGLFTVLFGLSSFLTLPHSPGRARFLTEEEKEYVVARLRETGATGLQDEADSFSWNEIWKAFTLPHVFTPSILSGLGYTNVDAQLYSVPPFAAAFVVSIVVSYLSDRYGARGIVTIFSGILATIGFAMFYASHSPHIKYGSLFLSITGAYNGAPALSTWNANNTAPYTRRATAIAIGFIMTNSGGILATWLLGTLSPAPLYTKATLTLLIFSILMVVFSAMNIGYLASQNRKKATIRDTTSREDEALGLGDRSAWFPYSL
ncbi:hypothetical protein C0992_006499 [Termitomyces sp. T32_za158]|nr:hypothetical protein C0992_006499 [Termitomyces sp. T32_za158]